MIVAAQLRPGLEALHDGLRRAMEDAEAVQRFIEVAVQRALIDADKLLALEVGVNVLTQRIAVGQGEDALHPGDAWRGAVVAGPGVAIASHCFDSGVRRQVWIGCHDQAVAAGRDQFHPRGGFPQAPAKAGRLRLQAQPLGIQGAVAQGRL